MKKLTILFFLALTSCATSYEPTFRKHLTPEEKAQLIEGQVITKTHTSYLKNGQVDLTGTLKIKVEKGKYTFTQLGEWKHYHNNGQLLSLLTHDSSGRMINDKIYNEDGSRYSELFGYDEVQWEKTARITKHILFFPGSGSDTASVEMFLSEGRKHKRHGVCRYYDRQGNIIEVIEYRNGKKVK
ncbi:hypothetical protein [Rufibacter sp. XAAS-G3-1]|uniref:hypothetical protein n=1 Tax=Rufibacter sp. XAAS-G3-1 TaxID=2729134 RepID=UPI0015E765AD|nr:hypothetical protein [Rufibacter sp. XAAS-G3-1]